MKTLLIAVLLVGAAFAQEAKIETAAASLEVSIDGLTTQQLGVEHNPAARWLVQRGAMGQTFASSLGFAAVLESRHILTPHHPKIAKWGMRIFLIAYGYNDVRQVRLVQHLHH